MEPTLASEYTGQDLSGWLVSEKMDGIRAIWTGDRLESREGNDLRLPAEIARTMPRGIRLDGELWGGRGTFQEVAAKVRAGDFSGIKFHIFDAQADGTWNDRISLANLTCGGVDFIEFAEHLPAFQHDIYGDIIDNGGEGVVYRDPSASYIYGKSLSLLKRKPIKDAEAVVMSHNEKRTVAVEWSGKRFNLTYHGERPEIGSKVTFRYRGLYDSGKPRHAAYVTVRDYE